MRAKQKILAWFPARLSRPLFAESTLKGLFLKALF